MVTISGDHAPVLVRGSSTEEGMLDVAVMRTSGRGTAKSSSSSAISCRATVHESLAECLSRCSEELTYSSASNLAARVLQLNLRGQPSIVSGSEPLQTTGPRAVES